jgi:hypothetical protein
MNKTKENPMEYKVEAVLSLKNGYEECESFLVTIDENDPRFATHLHELLVEAWYEKLAGKYTEEQYAYILEKTEDGSWWVDDEPFRYGSINYIDTM